MGSNAKKKTTMAKLNREHKLREKRAAKAARKEARKLAALEEATNPTVVVEETELEETELRETEREEVPAGAA